MATDTDNLDSGLGGGAPPPPPADPNGAEAAKAAEAAAAKKAADAKALADTPEGKAAAEKKATEDAAAKKVADEKLAAEKAKDFDVKFGDLHVDEKVAGKFKDAAKKFGLDGAKAQELADVYVEAQKSQDAAIAIALEQQTKNWRDSMRADKEIGGEAFKGSVLNARKVIEAHGQEFKAALAGEYAFLANFPPLVKMLARIGKADAEDALPGAAGAGAAPAALTEDEKLAQQYPKMTARLAREKAARSA